MGWIAPIAGAAAQRAEEDRILRQLQTKLGNNWEFKIVRSFYKFEDEDHLSRVITEEALAGWQIAYRIDAARLIFKRPVEAQAWDDTPRKRKVHPYREYYDKPSPVAIGAIIFGLLGLLLVVLLGFALKVSIAVVLAMVIGLAVLFLLMIR